MLPKTFNNLSGFERGFWRREMGLFLTVSKRRVFGTGLIRGLVGGNKGGRYEI
jgi:hypothetical protein